MAAAVTKTEETIGVIKKIKWAWVAHTDGKVAVTTTGAKTDEAYNGEIIRVITVPDGTTAPTALYDVYIYDEDGTDILMGNGEGRSATATEQGAGAGLGIVANDKLNLYVEGAGSGGKGTVYLYIR